MGPEHIRESERTALLKSKRKKRQEER